MKYPPILKFYLWVTVVSGTIVTLALLQIIIAAIARAVR